MKLFSRGSTNFSASGPIDGAIELEDVTFFAEAVLVLIVPALLLCLVLGQFWPLLLVAGSQTLGGALGVVRFKNSFDAVQSCVPEGKKLNASRGANSVDWRKAA